MQKVLIGIGILNHWILESEKNNSIFKNKFSKIKPRKVELTDPHFLEVVKILETLPKGSNSVLPENL